MKKYKNNSGKDVGFIVDGKTLDFQNGQVLSVPDNFKENIQKVVDNIMLMEETKATPVEVPVAIAEAPKKTTKKVKK
jgi:hypothetical protein